jgi:UDP-N-acetyl-D-glucosamine dehydrogenase
VPELPTLGLFHAPLDEALDDADLAVIVTAHPGVDHHEIAGRVPTVDLRGALREPRTSRAARTHSDKEEVSA